MLNLLSARAFSKELKKQFPKIKHVAIFEPLIDEYEDFDRGLVSILLPTGVKKKEVEEWINSMADKLDPEFDIEIV